jgi:hypothetical protein
MSKAQTGTIEIEDSRLEWDEVAEIAGDLFDVQGGASGGLQWANSAWRVISEADLNRYFREVERTVCVLRFIALFALHREFCVRAFDEGNAGDWEYIAPAGLIGDYPMVDAFSLGQLAEQRDIFVNNDRSGVWDAQSEVIALLAKVEYRQVLNVLQARWGKKQLFAKLYASRGIEPILDLLGQEMRNPVSGTGQATGVPRAWEWYAAKPQPHATRG